MKMTAAKEYSPEELNHFRICYVTTEIIANGLRKVFKREWDTRYNGTYDAWEDTAQNGIDLNTVLVRRSRRGRNPRELTILRNGNRLEWDCTCLFTAILHFDSSARCLDPAVRNAVDELRIFRNEVFAHTSSGKLTEAEFRTSIERVITAFTTLNLDTSDIEEIRNQKTFPTKELRAIMKLLEKEKMRNEEPQPFCVLPPKPSHQVSHREEEVKNVLQKMGKLRSTKPNEITVIYLSGNPGCGKSEIARQIGEKVFDGDQDPEEETEAKFVFTINASSVDALIESYSEFALSLKCDEASTTTITTSKDLSQDKKLIHLKSLVAPKLRKYSSWLLIVDNITDLKSVFKYLPKAGEKTNGKGQILVTTQDSRSIAADSTNHLSLSQGMSHDEATRTLSLISGVDDESAFEVAKNLDSQPLALACAATYMKRVRMTTPRFSWQEYLQKLQQGKREATEMEYKNTSVAYSQTMTAAVRLAIEKEVAEDAVMRHAFDFLSVIAPEKIPLEYVVQYITRRMPDKDKEHVAAHIASSSLILSSEGQSQEISVHQVVHGCLNTIPRPQMNGKEEFHSLLNVIQAFSSLLSSFDENNVDDIMKTKSLTVHFVIILKKLSDATKPNIISEIPFGEEENIPDCLLPAGRICKLHGKYEQACSFFTIALKIKEKRYGENHPALTSTLNQLGGILGNLGKHEEANTYLNKALSSIEEEFFDENHIDKLVYTLNNLGINLGDLGRHKEAKSCLETVLVLEEKLFGPHHQAVASTLNNLGKSLDDLGEYTEAKSCFERALTIEETVFGPHHPALASTLSNLGNSLGSLEQNREAENCLRRALAIEEMCLGSNHPVLASTLSNLGNILSDLGEDEEAKSCYVRALTIEKMTLGPNHPDVASTLNNLGLCFFELDEHEEAKSRFERALAIEEMALGQNHPELASTLSNLGLCLLELGEHEEAKSCFLRTLIIEEKALGPNHQELVSTLNNLGKSHRALGEHKDAKICFKRASAIESSALDPHWNWKSCFCCL